MSDITFGYSDSEDRIWLSIQGSGKFWVVRRLLAQLVPPVAGLLEKTVPGGDLPHALPASVRVRLEHEESLADGPEGQTAMAANKESRHGQAGIPTPPALLSTLQVQVNETECRLKLISSQGETNITATRMEFHRLMAAFCRLAYNAGWELPDLPDWLATNMNDKK